MDCWAHPPIKIIERAHAQSPVVSTHNTSDSVRSVQLAGATWVWSLFSPSSLPWPPSWGSFPNIPLWVHSVRSRCDCVGHIQALPWSHLEGRDYSGCGLGCGLTLTGILLACALALVVTGAWCGQGAQFVILGQDKSLRHHSTTSSPGKWLTMTTDRWMSGWMNKQTNITLIIIPWEIMYNR